MKLHKIIGFVIHWPVIMSKLVCKRFRWDFCVFKICYCLRPYCWVTSVGLAT